MASLNTLVLVVATLSAVASEPGDRHPQLDCVYPAEVFLHAGDGGRVIDVTKPPFGAKGDGTTDDTVALIKAYDFVLAEMDKAEWTGAGPQSPLHEYIIYLPNRTYLVSDTIIYSGPWRQYSNQNREPGAKLFLNNGNGMGKNDRVFVNGRFWVRFMNTEWKQSPSFTCNGSDMWVFGYKVEGRMTNFQAIHGGRLEVLGGVCNEHGHDFSPEIPVVRNVDSSLGFVGCTNGPNKFEVIVEETISGQTKRPTRTDCPPRPGIDGRMSWKDIVMPLYISVPK